MKLCHPITKTDHNESFNLVPGSGIFSPSKLKKKVIKTGTICVFFLQFYPLHLYRCAFHGKMIRFGNL